jgi:hypothetical protein
MSEQSNEHTSGQSTEQDRPAEDEVVEPDASGVGPREDDQTVSAEDLVELKDDPKPMEPSD